MKVIFYETFEAEQGAIQKLLPAEIEAIFTSRTLQSSELQSLQADIISVRTQSILPEKWYLECKAILSRSKGYEHLKIPANVKNIHMGFLSEYCSYAVAEHAIVTMMMLLRNTVKQLNQFKTFHRENLTGREVRGKTVLVCGVGNIGYEAYQLSLRLGMTCFGFDIEHRYADVKYIDLLEGIRASDVIICALPANTQTIALLDYKKLSFGKQDKILVNISRGEVTPIRDLERLLCENKLSGVSLDVYENESILGDSLRGSNIKLREEHQCLMRIQQFPNVICTPHNAFNTIEALMQKAQQTVQSILEYQRYGKFPNEISTST